MIYSKHLLSIMLIATPCTSIYTMQTSNKNLKIMYKKKHSTSSETYTEIIEELYTQWDLSITCRNKRYTAQGNYHPYNDPSNQHQEELQLRFNMLKDAFNHLKEQGEITSTKT